VDCFEVFPDSRALTLGETGYAAILFICNKLACRESSENFLMVSSAYVISK
jgi:hypothetical protein